MSFFQTQKFILSVTPLQLALSMQRQVAADFHILLESGGNTGTHLCAAGIQAVWSVDTLPGESLEQKLKSIQKVLKKELEGDTDLPGLFPLITLFGYECACEFESVPAGADEPAGFSFMVDHSAVPLVPIR